jgi:hypothetical protein
METGAPGQTAIMRSITKLVGHLVAMSIFVMLGAQSVREANIEKGDTQYFFWMGNGNYFWNYGVFDHS